MQEFITEVLMKFADVGILGYVLVLLLIAIENIFPPIPSEVILTFGGFLTLSSRMTYWGVVISATIGAVLGALVLYGVGRILNPQRLERLIDSKVGRILRFKKEDVSKSTEWFSKKGKTTVFFCRFIPIVRSLISIPAGITKMEMPIFLLLTTAGTFIWNIVLVYLGKALGDLWENVLIYMDTYSFIALVVLGVIFLVLAFIFYKKRIATKGEDNVAN
ncbi:MAG: DedA family protein [Clostridiales bacterium]|nr:DedA family protein [Clostridiales bacterium]